MTILKIKYFLFSVLLLNAITPLTQASSASLNISTDLARLGIYKKNVRGAPAEASFAGFAISAAVSYASKHHIPVVLFPKGNYYFDSDHGKDLNGVVTHIPAHLFMNGVTQVSIEGSGSQLHFSDRTAAGWIINNSSHVTLSDFSIDYDLDLPYTSARIDASHVTMASNGKLQLDLILGTVYGRPVRDLKTDANSVLRVFILRKNPSTGGFTSITARLSPSQSMVDAHGVLHLLFLDADPSARSIKTGDLLSLSERRNGANALSFVNRPPAPYGEGNAAHAINIFSSPAIGLGVLWQKGCTFDNIRIKPNDQRFAALAQLISSNADGINLTNGGEGNSVTHSSVEMTGDDGISFSTGLYGKVTSVDSSKNSMVITSKNGVSLNQVFAFEDSNSLKNYGEAKVIAVNPGRESDSYISFISDGDMQRLRKNGLMETGQVFMKQLERSPGTRIEGNMISNGFARGIYFAGVDSPQIIDNKIFGSTGPGILGQRANEASGAILPEVTNAIVENNSLVQIFSNGVYGACGAITFGISNDGRTGVDGVNTISSLKGNSIDFLSLGGLHTEVLLSHSTLLKQ